MTVSTAPPEKVSRGRGVVFSDDDGEQRAF